MAATVAPFGTWVSPVAPELLVAGAAGLADVWGDEDGTVWWVESRPSEAGRVQVVRRDPDGTVTDLLPEGFSARSRVHEYGGGAVLVDGGVVYFANWADQRLYRLGADGTPQPLTPEPAEPHGWRWADLRRVPGAPWLVGVRENHHDPSQEGGGHHEPANEIVGVPLEDGEITVLASGRDFVAAPRPSRDGRQLAWICWDHPNMPWDTTELWLAHLDAGPGRIGTDGAHRTAGGHRESLLQPEWGRHGQLFAVSDRSGWWNVYRVDGVDRLAALAPVEAEVGQPAWVFGQSRYGFAAPSGDVVFTWSAGGSARLGRVAAAGGDLAVVEVDALALDKVRVVGEAVLAIASSVTHEPVVARFPLDGGATAVVRPCRDLGLPETMISRAEAVTFPSAGGRTAHAYLYRPTNGDVAAADGERAPLLVLSHGGPTSAASPAFSLGIQFWTSRGFAVMDVDYGGSTGYGRAYRELLQGAWGVVDVDDCCAAADYAVEIGVADPARLAIRGGSAGGFTTLAALAFRSTFAAGANSYGVADLAALAQDTHKFEARYLDGLVGPWPEAAERYRERSPLAHADRLSCPIITLQGLEDAVVPPNQSEMLVAALAAKGIPHAYLAFEGEQHGFRNAATIVRALTAELYFFGQVFGFEPAGPIEPIDIVFGEKLGG
jgi:dipeptidyl aminopeptidase/acylaminoacyl peptidase